MALFVLVTAIDRAWGLLPDREPRADALVPMTFAPVAIDPAGFAPLALAGAWSVEVADRRFGGISSLAVDGDRLVALSDSGVVIEIPLPGTGSKAALRDLPNGPVSAYFKKYRDSEALARDPGGRGWWVAFENRHELWLYDPEFRRSLARVVLGPDRWPANQGVEAMVANDDRLMVFPETAREWLEIGGGRVRSRPLISRFGFISDGARAPDGRILLVARKMALAGIAKRLIVVEEGRHGLTLRSLARLELGPLDNVERWLSSPGAMAPHGCGS